MTVLDGAALAPAAVRELVEGDTVVVDAGCDLLDADGFLVEDISADLIASGSDVERGIFNRLHGSCRLNLTRPLRWGSDRVRPYMLLGDGVSPDLYRFDLGVYLVSTPEREVGSNPPTWAVDGFDKLDVLNTPIGRSFSVAANSNVVAAVVALIVGAGEERVDIVSSPEVTTGARTFSISDNWTTLTIANDLLDSIGHRALWVDNAGVYRSVPYQSPDELAPMFTYDASSLRTSVGEQRRSTQDYYGAANVVVAVDNDPARIAVPTEGNGIATLVNQDDGPTSINSRGGRVIRRVVSGAYSSQEALVSAAQRSLDAERRVTEYVEIKASPNPTHGHFDVVNFRDDAIPANGRYLVTDWKLPLDGSDMTINLRAV